MKLSICMMIKNEEEHLKECLTSLSPFFTQTGLESELIIVDTGSTDNSIAIATEFTNKIYFHDWNNDFAAMRNITISYATGEWIFIIDGDEVLYNAENIIEFLMHPNSKKFNTGALLVKSWIDSDMKRFTVLNSFRLFRRDDDLRYEGKVHNQPVFKQPLVNFTEAELIHYGYIYTDKELMDRKFERTVTLLKEELEANPENLYYWYQLGESYGLYGKHELSLEAMMKAYDLAIKKGEKGKRDYLYIFIGAGKRNMLMKKAEEAEKILKDILIVGDEYPDLHYFLGYALFVQGKVNEAINHYEKYIYIVENFDKCSSSRDLSVKNETITEIDKVYKIVAEEYYKLEMYDKAELYFKSYEKEKEDKNIAQYLIYALYKQNKIQELFEYYQEKYSEADEKYQENLMETIEHIYHQSTPTVRVEIAKLFKNGANNYAVLNLVRYLKLENRMGELFDTLESIDLLSWNIKSGELLWRMIECNINLVEKTKLMYEVEMSEKIEQIMPQLSDLKEMFDFDIIKKHCFYLEENYKNYETVAFFRYMKAINRMCLFVPDTSDEIYKYSFNNYIFYGISYLTHIYELKILENEEFYHLKNLEDKFLMYMWKADNNKNNNSKMYINYLTKALETGGFEKGIKSLLDNFNNTKSSIEELDELKVKFKSSIVKLIEQNLLEEANLLIMQYEQIVSDDPEILLFKTEILIGKNTAH